MVRECYSCGSRPCDTPFPSERIKGLPVVCLDCALEWASDVAREQRCFDRRVAIMEGDGPISRRSWRARLRVRASSRQLDLVDALLPRV